MKVNEIDFSKYTYKRICINSSPTAYFPENTEATIIREYGEREVDGEPEAKDTGWLTIKLK